MIRPRFLSAIRNPAFFFALVAIFAACSRAPSDVPARESADWVRDAVVLELSVRSFSAEGTFGAVTNRAEVLRTFGVSVLVLAPIHPIGDLNRVGLLGDPDAVQDFYAVNPEFGTMEDFRTLVETVHRQGMKVLIDMPATQAAWDSKLMFEHPEWFLKDESGAIISPDAHSTDVAGLNYSHHELRKYMIAVMEFWVRDVGVDGYRFEKADRIPTDFWEIVRSRLEDIKPVMMISGAAVPEHHVEGFDVTVGWNSFNAIRDILGGISKASSLNETLANEQRQFPAGSMLLRIPDLPNDSLRDSRSSFKSEEEKLLVAASSFFIPGIPLIRDGGEFGSMRSDEGAGSATTALYKKLGAMRAELPALRRGEYVRVGNSREDIVTSFERRYEGRRVIVLLNWGNTAASVIVNPEVSEAAWKDYVDGGQFSGDGKIEMLLKPFSFKVIVSEGHPQ